MDDDAAAVGLPPAMKIELSDLTVYAKNYNVRPGLTVEDRMILENPKPHDIFV